MAKKSKKYLEAAKLFDKNTRYSLDDAIDLAKKTSITKFDATIELAVRLNLDPRKADQNLRGAVVLPHGTGKTRKVLVLTKGPLANDAKEAGADYVGDVEYIEQIKGGWFDFYVIVATPDMMGELGKIGKILGPKGLMPNAKTGTVTMDVAKAVAEIKAGKVEYRVDKTGNIQVIIGKASFDNAQLLENAITIYRVLMRLKPSTVKGVYVKNVVVASTMGPGVKVAFDALGQN